MLCCGIYRRRAGNGDIGDFGEGTVYRKGLGCGSAREWLSERNRRGSTHMPCCEEAQGRSRQASQLLATGRVRSAARTGMRAQRCERKSGTSTWEGEWWGARSKKRDGEGRRKLRKRENVDTQLHRGQEWRNDVKWRWHK